jgi:hypothetical protein
LPQSRGIDYLKEMEKLHRRYDLRGSWDHNLFYLTSENGAGGRDAKGKLERFSSSLPCFMPDLSIAGDDTHETHSLATGLAAGSARRAGR